MRVSVEQKNIDKLGFALKHAATVAPRTAIQRALYIGGEKIRNIAKSSYLSGPRPKFLGVKTGRLRSSIYSAVHKDYVAIGTAVEYAPIHEYGGMAGRNRKVKIPARPYLSPSLEAVKKEFPEILEKEFHNELMKILRAV